MVHGVLIYLATLFGATWFWGRSRDLAVSLVYVQLPTFLRSSRFVLARRVLYPRQTVKLRDGHWDISAIKLSSNQQSPDILDTPSEVNFSVGLKCWLSAFTTAALTSENFNLPEVFLPFVLRFRRLITLTLSDGRSMIVSFMSSVVRVGDCHSALLIWRVQFLAYLRFVGTTIFLWNHGFHSVKQTYKVLISELAESLILSKLRIISFCACLDVFTPFSFVDLVDCLVLSDGLLNRPDIALQPNFLFISLVRRISSPILGSLPNHTGPVNVIVIDPSIPFAFATA